MAEGQRWVGGAQGRDAHRVEPGVVQPFGVVVVVSEDQDSFPWAVPHVEDQPPVAPRVRVGDVAQADDRVVGVYAPAPFPCCRARGTDRNWTRVDRKMLWSPAASSSQQRARVLTDVKARRFAPPPLRGADGLDVGSAHGSSRLALADDAHSYTPYMLWSPSCPE